MRLLVPFLLVSLLAVANADVEPAHFGGGGGFFPPFNTNTFIAQLSGRNAVPPVTDFTDLRASGTLVATLDERFRTFKFQLWISNVNNLILVDIHVGGPGQIGPPIAFLVSSFDPEQHNPALVPDAPERRKKAGPAQVSPAPVIPLPFIAPLDACTLVTTGVIQPADLVDLDGTISSNITDTNGDGINSDDLWTFFVARLKSNGIYVDAHTTKYVPPAAILRSQIYPSSRRYAPADTYTCPRTSFTYKHISAKALEAGR